MRSRLKFELMCSTVLRMLVFLTCAVALGQQKIQSFDKNYNVNVKVNNRMLTLTFDTGAGKSVLNSEVLKTINKETLQTVSKENFIDGFGNIKTIDVYKGLVFSILNIDKFPAFIFNDLDIYKFLNCFENKNDGVLGLNFFMDNSNELLRIDHDKNEIEITDKEHLSLSDFSEVGADFRNNSIYIDAEIGGKYVELLFDTGYDGYVLLNKNYRKLRKYNEVEIFTNTSASLLAMSQTEEITLEGVGIEFGNIDLKNNLVTVNTDNTVPLLGAAVIKKFNWIIDFKNEKLYLQKRKGNFEVLLSDKLKKKNVVLAVMGKMYIISSFQKGFRSGGIITTVNDIPVSLENICDIQKLLNDNGSDWTELKIETN